MVGVHLGFKMAELHEYEEKEPKSPYGRLFRLLADWKDRERHATVGAVVAACREAGVEGAAKRALQALASSSK